MDSRSIIAITMGDAAGVGPEIVVKTLALEEVYALCRPLVVGDAGVLARARVVHVTRHLPLRQVADSITRERVLETIQLTLLFSPNYLIRQSCCSAPFFVLAV